MCVCASSAQMTFLASLSAYCFTSSVAFSFDLIFSMIESASMYHQDVSSCVMIGMPFDLCSRLRTPVFIKSYFHCMRMHMCK